MQICVVVRIFSIRIAIYTIDNRFFQFKQKIVRNAIISGKGAIHPEFCI